MWMGGRLDVQPRAPAFPFLPIHPFKQPSLRCFAASAGEPALRHRAKRRRLPAVALAKAGYNVANASHAGASPSPVHLPPSLKEGAERRFVAMDGSTRSYKARQRPCGRAPGGAPQRRFVSPSPRFTDVPEGRSTQPAPGARSMDRGVVSRGLPRYSACEAFGAGAAPCPTSLAPHEAPSVDQGARYLHRVLFIVKHYLWSDSGNCGQIIASLRLSSGRAKREHHNRALPY